MSDSTNDAGDNKSWFGRLAGGLKRSSSSLGAAIVDLVTKGPMDPAKLDMIQDALVRDRKSTRLNSSHQIISYAVFCLKKKKKNTTKHLPTTQHLNRWTAQLTNL